MMARVLAFCAFAAILASPAFANNPGRLEQTDVTTTEVSKAAEFAVQQINLQSNSNFAMILSSVVEASSQLPVVSGMKYKLVVETLPSTDCRNGGELHTLCSCSVNTSKPVGYQVEVWVRPWMIHSMQMLSFKQAPLPSVNSVDGVTKAKPLSIALAISSSPVEFQQFLKTYTPSYCNNAVEMSKRSDIFQDNMLRIKEFQEAEQGSAKYGVTKFADLTKSEFRAWNGMPMGFSKPDSRMKQAPPINADDIPTSFDWREHGAVTAVKDQGLDCGDCWAFGFIGNIESQWAIKKGHLVSLSEQQLVDCDKSSQGCSGGGMSAYDYAYGGLAADTTYPFTGKEGKCYFTESQTVAYINSTTQVSTNEAQMAAWLVANTPIAIFLNADAMMFYLGGISHPPKKLCNPGQWYINHIANIVGYGTQDGEPYWIVKNSWGEWWGEEGYWRVYRGDNTCGITTYPSSSVVY